MKKLIFWLSFLVLSIGLQGQEKFFGINSIAVEGNSNEGLIYTNKRKSSQIISEIEEQLKYTVGQFNGLGGVANLPGIKIELTDFNLQTTGVRRVKYKLRMLVSWPREYPIPEDFKLFLPERGSRPFLNKRFHKKYGGNDPEIKKSCLDRFQRSTISNHWFHYRPQNDDCPLKDRVPGSADLAVTIPIRLTRSQTNTISKYPEYEKIWEDDVLDVVILHSKDRPKSMSEDDHGYQEFLDMYDLLVTNFGEDLVEASLQRNEISPKTTRIDLSFKVGERRLLRVTLFLIGRPATATNSFIRKFRLATRNSDLVGYSGHAGLGRNVRAFEKLGSVKAGQYRIYLLNNCDTFGYLTGRILKRHKAANPEAEATKFVDIISTTMPADFVELSQANIEVVKSLVNARDSYSEILDRFPFFQRSVVTGEEDNRYPREF
jgi:hypothetical protein